MTVKIGMIGPGGMGQAHIDRIRSVIAGGEVVAVSDINPEAAVKVAEKYGATGYTSSADLIADPGVDAVMICSYGPAHEADVIACIEAGKRVFCEKPLTPTADAAERIMAAEAKAGRKMVTVGFMRRFDESYRQMKAILDSGEIGETLIVHNRHRNPTVPPHYTWDMAINDTGIHEIDTMRWLTREEIVSVRGVFLATRAFKTDAGNAKVRTGVQVDASETLNAEHALSQAPVWYGDVFELDPSTGLAWSIDNLNDLQTVIERTE